MSTISAHRLFTGIILFFGLALGQSVLPTVDLGYEIHRAALFNVGEILSVHYKVQLLTIAVHWGLLQLFQHKICGTSCRRLAIPCTCSAEG